MVKFATVKKLLASKHKWRQVFITNSTGRSVNLSWMKEEASEPAPAAGCPAWCFALALRDDQAVQPFRGGAGGGWASAQLWPRR